MHNVQDYDSILSPITLLTMSYIEEEEQTTQWPKEKNTKGQTTINKTFIYN
jgi:hypothetical protein